MTTLELGTEPEGLVVRLSSGAPFRASLRAEVDGVPVSWPVGTTLRLVLLVNDEERTWPFTITDSIATVTIPEVEVNAIPEWPAPNAQLWLAYGAEEEFLWCAGQVEFNA